MESRVAIVSEAIEKQPDASSPMIASTIFTQLVRQQRDEWFMELLTGYVDQVRRSSTRESERAVFDEFISAYQIRSNSAGGFAPLVQTVDGRELRDKLIALGDGRKVTWGEATADDHRQRIAMLEKLRGGLAETIGRHHQAIALIESAGVRCLDEIGREAPALAMAGV